MHGIFHVDGPVMSYVIKIFDCMCLSVLWVLCCIPIITVGASTTALYHTIYHYIRKERGSLLKTFFSAFLENWKRSTLLWIVVLVTSIVILVDILVFRTMAIQGDILGKLYWIILLLCAMFFTWIVYLMAYAARFQGTVLEVLRISCLLMVVHPFKSILVFLVFIIGIYLSILYTGFLTITPAIVCWGSSVIIESVFQCHMQS